MTADAEIFNRINQLEKDNAVTMDRTNRHDEEIRALTTDVKAINHELIILKGSVVSGFNESSANHKRILDAVVGLKAQTDDNTTQRIEWKAVIKYTVALLSTQCVAWCCHPFAL